MEISQYAFQRDHERMEKESGKTSWSSTKTNGKVCHLQRSIPQNFKQVGLGYVSGGENNQAEPGLSEPRKGSVLCCKSLTAKYKELLTQDWLGWNFTNPAQTYGNIKNNQTAGHKFKTSV